MHWKNPRTRYLVAYPIWKINSDCNFQSKIIQRNIPALSSKVFVQNRQLSFSKRSNLKDFATAIFLYSMIGRHRSPLLIVWLRIDLRSEFRYSFLEGNGKMNMWCEHIKIIRTNADYLIAFLLIWKIRYTYFLAFHVK